MTKQVDANDPRSIDWSLSNIDKFAADRQKSRTNDDKPTAATFLKDMSCHVDRFAVLCVFSFSSLSLPGFTNVQKLKDPLLIRSKETGLMTERQRNACIVILTLIKWCLSLNDL
jgi:hypothetical protein